MSKVVCFGEALLRMSPDVEADWLQKNLLQVYIGGAELNVATALARWHVATSYCSSLPDHYVAHQVVDQIKQNNIDTSSIVFRGERMGLYFLQQGADLKNAGVIYDRAGSSFATLVPGMIDWDTVLEGSDWLHITAISPALNEHVATVCEEALRAANAKNITTSIDLNYRSKLWQYGKNPTEVMPALVAACDVVMGNIWAANTLLGIPVDDQIHLNTSNHNYEDHATKTSRLIMDAYPRCKVVANTFRFDKNEKGIDYFATLNTSDDQYVSKVFSTEHVVNKIGSGDCFMAGLIYGLHAGHAMQDVVNFAASGAFGKLQETGDVTHQTIEEIKQRL